MTNKGFSQERSRYTPALFAACAGIVMLGAGFTPWLIDPVHGPVSPLALQVDIGWQMRLPGLSYGLLSLGVALYALFLAGINRWLDNGRANRSRSFSVAGLLCTLPIAIFVLQYLCADIQGINELAQHKAQALLIQRHFGYTMPAERIPLDPFALDSATLPGRLALLVDQASAGLLLPLVSAGLLFACTRFPARSQRTMSPHRRGRRYALLLTCVLALVLFGRAPASMLCEHEARLSLASGSYSAASGWLDAARLLNPGLERAAFYHMQRGQALYFQPPSGGSDEIQAYLAGTYDSERAYLDAYQQELALRNGGSGELWVRDEMSATLERLAELSLSPPAPDGSQPVSAASARSWLRLLIQVDPTNVYGQYMLGRVECDLHEYAACIGQMNSVLQLDPDSDIRSSCYTYMAFGEAGLGHYARERELLLQAVQLDPAYRNNTAREALSGLH